MRLFSPTKFIAILLIVPLLLSVLFGPLFSRFSVYPEEEPPKFSSAPMGISAQLIYPNIGRAAIVLNGSLVEVQLRGPNNISSWDFTLFREYQSYSITHGTPSFNSTTGIWSVNISIPGNAAWDLYNLNVTISDGLSQLNIQEWNAVQVRHSFSENFTIVHVTDTHFFPQSGDYSTKLRGAQYQAALAGADLMILTGDCTDDGEEGSFQYLRNVMRESRVPYLVGPGNHDRDSTGPTFRLYKSFFGTDYYTATIGPDIFIIMANTYQQTASNYRFNFTQLGWIERDLAASSAKTKIVAGHAPMIQPDSDDYFMQYDEAVELQRIARENNMTVYLSGHRHNDRVDLINGTHFILTTTLGGSVWTLPTDPGHHRNGFRRLVFEKNNLTSWSWTNWNWSQPWDEVKVNRQRTSFLSQVSGGYMQIINNLTTPLIDQQVDFLLEPLSGPDIYQIDGGTSISTSNGSTSWFLRASVDVPVDGVATLRVFPSNAQSPTIESVTYPDPGFTETVSQIFSEVTNPISGVERVELNLSIDSNPFSLVRMSQVGTDLFRYYQFFVTRTTLVFSVLATDFSGQITTSSQYSFLVTSQPSPPILANPGEVSLTGNVTLGWTSSVDDDGTIDYYTVQVSDDSDFTNILNEEDATGTTTTIYGLTNNTYFFRVQSVDNDLAASDWSNTQNVTVSIPPTTTPPPPPPPPPINWTLVLMAGGVVGVVVIIGGVVYFIRFRRAKPE
ncbi:MAG: metallophosphoesterase [Promethearchaeota archaeon]